jgi:hypothetical protein
MQRSVDMGTRSPKQIVAMITSQSANNSENVLGARGTLGSDLRLQR